MSFSIPQTMRGILIETTGGPEVLQYRTDLPVPEPKEGEVLIKNTFVGINFIDIYFRTGLYPSPKPEILGLEAKGVIAAVGAGETFSLQPHDHVVWTSSGAKGGAGGYAEYTAVPAARVIKIPDAIPSKDAVAALIQGLTALTLVRESHPVKKDEWILVHAAAGGCGLWLCRILKHIGAKTIGTASSAKKLKLAEEHGAGWTINYAEEDWVKRVDEITEGKGVAAVFDGVGKTTFDGDLEVLSPKGSLVSFGNASGEVEPLRIRKLAPKNIKLSRPHLLGYIATREAYEGYVTELFNWMIESRMRVAIGGIYPLKDAAKAHQDLEGRKTTGKILLTLLQQNG